MFSAVLFFLFSQNFLGAESLPKVTEKISLPKYEVGRGNKYLLNLNGDLSDVTIAFVESTDKKIVIEVAMQSKSDTSKSDIQMWQQFQLGLVNNRISIIKGIMQIPHISKPQILPSEYLQGYSGVQMKSFLIDSSGDMPGAKISVEKIVVDEKVFQATHYRRSENGQTIDFWISDEAKPLGLIKMSSSGGDSGMNYTMKYVNSVSGVKAHIKESEAEPLNDTAKAFLPLLGASLFKF